MKIIPTRLSFVLAAAAVLFVPLRASLQATAPITVAGGLLAPSKLLLSRQGNLIVSEAGTGPNTGRISIVDPATGARRTLLQGLPSGFAAPNNEPSGPSGLLMDGRSLYVTISTGDSVVSGPVPMTTIPNPAPSSPLFSCVLAIHFSARVEKSTGGFALSFADQLALKSGSPVVLNNGAGDKIVIELVADIPDYVAEPRPNLPANVRGSNPFGLVRLCDELFVVDASMNCIHVVDLDDGTVVSFPAFAPLPNTRGFGPPVVEAVPDSICVYGDKLLVTLLTGFPFPPGGAQVRLVDPETGASVPFVTGLNSVIDVLPVDHDGFLTLEFTTDMLAAPSRPPGRLQWFSTPGASPVVIADTLITPTGMTLDETTGTIFVSEMFTGRIVKVPLGRRKCAR